MTADELSAPLGQMPRKQRRKFAIAVPHLIAGGLALFLGTFVLWTIVGDDPFGGEPMVTAPVDLRAAAAVKNRTSQRHRKTPPTRKVRTATTGRRRSRRRRRKTLRQTRRQTPRPSPSSTARPERGRRW